MTSQPNLQISSAHNNVGGLTAIESVLTLDDSARGICQSFGNYRKGIIKFRADGTMYHSGFPSTSWVFPVLSNTQYVQFQTTYCGGADGFSGLVTVRTNTYSATVYGNFNATLILPPPSEMQIGQARTYDRNVAIRFIHMEAI